MSIELNCNLYKSTKICGFLTISDWYDISGNTISGLITTQRDILIKDCYILQSMLSISGNIYSNYYDKNYINTISSNIYSNYYNITYIDNLNTAVYDFLDNYYYDKDGVDTF